MLFIRSLAFNILFFIWTSISFICFLPFIFHYRGLMKCGYYWSAGVLWLLRNICNIKLRLITPQGFDTGFSNKYNQEKSSQIYSPSDAGKGFVLASNHQSAMETFIMYHLFKDAAFIFKKEIIYIPLFGFLNIVSGNIPVDRSKGIKAIQDVTKHLVDRVNKGRKVFIFPQGTRVKYGVREKLKPAVYSFYKEGVDILPVRLNSGKFWPKKSFWKYPGVVVIEVFAPLEQDLAKKELLEKLENIYYDY